MARSNVNPDNNRQLSVAIDLALSRLLINSSWQSAVAACERSLDGARALADDRPLVRALFYLGEARLFQGRLAEAEPLLIQARELSQRLHDRYRETAATQQLAKLYLEQKQYVRARELMAIAMRFYESRGPERNSGLGLIEHATLERTTGDLEGAIALARRALAMGQTLRDRALEILAQCSLAVCLLVASRLDEAKACVRTALSVGHEERMSVGLGGALSLCVAFATRAGNYEGAARLYGFNEEAGKDRIPRSAFLGLDPAELIRPIRENLGDARLKELIAQGATWSEEQGHEEALSVCKS